MAKVGNPYHDEKGRFSSGVAGAKKGAKIGAVFGAGLGSLRGAGLLLAKVHPSTALGAGAGAAIAGAVGWGAIGAAVGGITGLAKHKNSLQNHIAKQSKQINIFSVKDGKRVPFSTGNRKKKK